MQEITISKLIKKPMSFKNIQNLTLNNWSDVGLKNELTFLVNIGVLKLENGLYSKIRK